MDPEIVSGRIGKRAESGKQIIVWTGLSNVYN